MRPTILMPFLALAALTAQSQPATAAEATQDFGVSGRVSAIEGTLSGKGPYDTDTSELSRNAVLRTGDAVSTSDGAFAEIELPGGNFLRLGANTILVMNRIDKDSSEIGLTQGVAYLSRAADGPPAKFATVAGTVELGGHSEVRVSSDAAHTSLAVSVAAGSAELKNDKGAQTVHPNETLTSAGGQAKITAFNPSAGDAFDQWNADREQTVRAAPQPEHVATGTVGAYEMDGQGSWVDIDGYQAWKPDNVDSDWRPYSDGNWQWEEPVGWTWVDNQPWGYATMHYGRWYYRNALGWVWYPDANWAPAWVVWAGFGTDIGWAPCDFWGRPIYCYSFNSYYDWGAWNYCGAGYFYAGGGGYGHRGGGGTFQGTHYPETGVPVKGVPKGYPGKGAVRPGLAIQKFTAERMRTATPVPIHNPVSELAPQRIQLAAAAGRIPGVAAGSRTGSIVARAAVGGGVRPEPWNNRAAASAARTNTALRTTGWSGKTPGGSQGAQGWNSHGEMNRTGSQPAGHFQPPENREPSVGSRAPEFNAGNTGTREPVRTAEPPRVNPNGNPAFNGGNAGHAPSSGNTGHAPSGGTSHPSGGGGSHPSGGGHGGKR